MEKQFNQLKKDNPEWSSMVCFIETIRGKHLTERKIRHWFNLLVSKDDFDKIDRENIISSLKLITDEKYPI